MSNTKKPSPASPAGEAGAAPDRGRYSAKRKTEAVLRLLKGEPLDAVSRDFGVTAATLSEWREEFIAAGTAGLKSRAPAPVDDEVRRLKHLIGEMTVDHVIVKERLKQLADPSSPFFKRRSTP
jgi:transposase-like protein